MEKLIVSNFGAIQHIEIEIKNLTIFIGKSGTGKSTLAKLIAIFRSVDFWLDKDFHKYLAAYGITNYIQENTVISYNSVDFIFFYDGGNITKTFSQQFQNSIRKFLKINMQAGDNIQLTIEKATQLSIKENLYIPSERNLIPLLREGQFEEGLKDANIPAGVIAFGEAYMRAAKFLQTYKTNIFDVTFQRKGTEDYIVLPNEKTLKLSEVASGMQTTIPALLVLEHLAKNGKPRSFTFEEPELNLFPTAQKALVEFLAEKVLNNGHQLVICTHSPYILTSFNNLLYAYELGVKKRKNNLPIPKNNWLDIEQVSGYLVENGTTENIFNSETYMLIAEKIDEAGEQIRDIFNELLDIDSED